jgi:choline dehydrogenase-like flavoprotein
VTCLLRRRRWSWNGPSGEAVSGVLVALGAAEIRVEAGTVVLAAGGIENPRLLLLSDRRCPGGIGNGHGLVGRFFMEHPYVNSGLLHAGEAADFRFYSPHRLAGASGLGVTGVFTLPDHVVRRERLLNVAVFLRPAWRVDPVFGSDGVQAAERLMTGLRRGVLPAGAGRAIARMAIRPDQLARAIGLRLGLVRPPGSGEACVRLPSRCPTSVPGDAHRRA